MSYDPNNIFARILRGEISCKKVYEDDKVLAFNDINPQAPVHVLIIPKGPYVNAADLAAQGSDAELAALWRAVPIVAELTGVKESGYRVLANIGRDGHQEVPHLHLHLIGGRQLGRMISRSVMETR
jgi:histidine triad (HIT) family protein